MVSMNPVKGTPPTRSRYTINTMLAPDAFAILRKYVPLGSKKLGQFVGRLLYEYEARQDERTRLAQERME